MSEPAISVVIPARDARPTLERTLDALARQTLDAPFEVIVVDDGSTDGTASIVAAFPFARAVRHETSRGPGAARNQGVALSHAPVIAFTDADCFPESRWLEAGLAAIAGGHDIVQGQVLPDPTAPRTPFDRTVIVPSESGFYPTANLFVRRELFDSVGGFVDWVLDHDGARGRLERRPPDRRRGRAARTPIGEDTLFAWRARRAGARTSFSADALVHHAVVPGRLSDEVLDRWHWARDMPGATRLIPELRHHSFYRRWFFSRKTAYFDVACAGVLSALLSRRTPPLVLALPYARWLWIEARRYPDARDGARHAGGSIVSDAATLIALLTGSAGWRCPVL